MEGWQKRVLVYGAVGVCAVFAVLARTGALDAKPAPLSVLHGWTTAGSRVEMSVHGARVAAFRIEPMGQVCDGSYRFNWTPSMSQANVAYRQAGLGFTAHEYPDPRFPQPPGWRVNTYMAGSIAPDGSRVGGVLWYLVRSGAHACRSGRIAFSATRSQP